MPAPTLGASFGPITAIVNRGEEYSMGQLGLARKIQVWTPGSVDEQGVRGPTLQTGPNTRAPPSLGTTSRVEPIVCSRPNRQFRVAVNSVPQRR
jgi:hypothetical protein